MSGCPLTSQAIVDSVRLAHPAAPEGDVKRAMRGLESGGEIVGTHNEVLEAQLWAITDKGRLALSNL